MQTRQQSGILCGRQLFLPIGLFTLLAANAALNSTVVIACQRNIVRSPWRMACLRLGHHLYEVVHNVE
jgi:hypothetical protein